jgi:hypothetical protein
MKNLIFGFLFALSSVSFAANKLKYLTVVDLSEYTGQTYFSLMNEVIKPSLDQYATEGFEIANGKTLLAALKKVDSQVANKAIKSAGSIEKLQQIGDALAGKTITFYELPAALAAEGVGSGRYDLATFISLASGGGVAININSKNTAYNVNYGTGENENDERTGRSFGEAPGRLALDASDKHYLEILEGYVRSEGENTEHFFRSILQILLNSDASDLKNVSESGQAVASDFIAVYTAEQNRHLMSNLQRHPWDASLLEVTLLSALHSGQKTVMVMFNGQFTDKTLKQASGCTDANDRQEKPASMIDYWQFSTNTDPAHCTRSGLNVTRKEFRNLGAAITAYQKEKHPELVENIQRHFSSSKNKNNVFAQLSDFLISYDTTTHLDEDTLELAEDFTAFLMQVRKDANKTSSFIASQIQTIQ